MISDGDDNLSDHALSEAIEGAIRAETAIYAISTNTDWVAVDDESRPSKYHLDQGDKILQKFADEVMATARREMTRDETNYIPQHARPVTGGRKPFKSEILADRKERFAGINKFGTERGGWLTSVPGERAVEMHCLADSTLPDELRKLG